MTRRSRADEHDEFYQTSLGREVLEAEVDLLLDLLPAEGLVLSLGCGIGVHEVELERRRPGLYVVCLDIQDEMLGMAPRRLDRVLADMTALPIGDGTFDAAFMVTSLEFVSDPARALREAVRCLRPGGVLVLLALNPSSDWGRARLRQLPATWGDLSMLETMVATSTGGRVDVGFALNLGDDVLTDAEGPDDAALLVLVSPKASDKSLLGGTLDR